MGTFTTFVCDWCKAETTQNPASVGWRKPETELLCEECAKARRKALKAVKAERAPHKFPYEK